MNTPVTDHPPTAEQLMVFAAQLDEQRRFRLEQLREHARRLDLIPARPLTVVDREIDDAIIGGARLALAEIDSARARMAHGRYGKCVDCGAQLPIERLEVLPSVPRCLPCARDWRNDTG
jgi:RNA polymerase-binding transcription factor DksA